MRKTLAMTVAEVSAVGLPAIYVPLPIGNGEQRLNALPVVNAGGGMVVPDAVLTPDLVATQPHWQNISGRLRAKGFDCEALFRRGQLTLLDADPRGILMETLEALLTRGSVKGAAGALNLHRHTVLYRMEKLRDLLAVDLDDPAARQRLQLALALRRLA